MKIALGCDHFGFDLKTRLIAWLQAHGHEAVDCGGRAEPEERLLEVTDAVCAAVKSGQVDRGIVMCMSGGLVTVRVNRWKGIRGVLGWNVEALKHDRAASDVNVLTLSGRFMAPEMAEALVDVFLAEAFEPLPRRLARLANMDEVRE